MIVILDKDELQKKPKDLRRADVDYTLTAKVKRDAEAIYIIDGSRLKIIKHDNSFKVGEIVLTSNLGKLIFEGQHIDFTDWVVNCAKDLTPKTITKTIIELERLAFNKH